MPKRPSTWWGLGALLAVSVGTIAFVNAGDSPATVGGPAGASAVLFPGCFDHQIAVGGTVVYEQDASCNSTTTVPASSTTSAPSTTIASTTTASPTTTAAPTTTTTIPTTTTTAATTTSTVPATTSTTVAATTTTAPSGGSACGLTSAAFCDTFDAPHNGGTQTGDLDPVIWGVSRIGDSNPGQGMYNAVVVSHNACAAGAASPAPSDIRVCNGQMVDSLNDGGGVFNINTYPKQPFNFAGRTGKVVFDVSADSDGTHADWPEFLITDKPVPGVKRCVSECNLGEHGTPTARNQVGFSIANSGPTAPDVGIDTFFVSVNGVYANVNNDFIGTQITKGSRAAMNHIEVRVSKTRIDVYGTDAGATVLKHIGGANINLAFEQGLVWLNDAHYNARKAIEPCECGTHYDHSVTWDNLGFDGPKTYRDWGFDVPLNNKPSGNGSHGDPQTSLGYLTGTSGTLTVTGVQKGAATSALVVYNSHSWATTPIGVSVNGHPAVTTDSHDSPFHVEAPYVTVPIGDVVNGTNTITFTSNDWSTSVANVSLIMVAAAPVP